ncbi:uncharacterized protein TNCV_204591 [Trichonephila clavipes]|nr:uncharacterized protein TNCV_204591 [Trichonephila clavipes]
MSEQQKALLQGVNTLKDIIENVERRQEELRNTLEKKMEQVEERYERVAGNFSLISQRVEDFEKKLLSCGNATNESKFVPAALVPEPASPMSVKLYTYDGKTNWEVYKIQFGIISKANRWTEEVKAFQPEILQRLCPPADENKTSETRRKFAGVETAIQASCIDRHSIQEARVTADEPCESRCIKGIEKLKEEMQALIAERQNRRRRSITCWGCGESGHLRMVNRDRQMATKHPGCHVDYFTKWPEAYPIPDQEASTVAEVLVQH